MLLTDIFLYFAFYFFFIKVLPCKMEVVRLHCINIKLHKHKQTVEIHCPNINLCHLLITMCDLFFKSLVKYNSMYKHLKEKQTALVDCEKVCYKCILYHIWCILA